MNYMQYVVKTAVILRSPGQQRRLKKNSVYDKIT